MPSYGHTKVQHAQVQPSSTECGCPGGRGIENGRKPSSPPKKRFTTSIKWAYYIHKRKNNTHNRHFFLFVLCPSTLNTHLFSVASFISYFSVSFSGSHSTSRFLCHFQYLLLSPGFSVIFSTSLYLQVSLSFSIPHSISRFLCHFHRPDITIPVDWA